ncbi:MAG: xanthine dehydrogenase family protein subunit M [Pararhodobacter sp.]|nr:xanthine dehydrogenase family protein subunit M [Pararhodobacter sp.]
MYAFDFVKPATLADAVTALGQDGAMPLSGGQTLLPTMKQRLNSPETLVSLTGITDLKGVRREGDALVIGAATTHAEVARDAAGDYPGLAALAGQIGDPAVRSRGTLGGSIANNDPSACYPAAVLGSGATIITNMREISAGDFFQGMFATALEEGEIITAIRFPIPERSAYAKFHQPASRFALTGAFVAQYAGGVHVAITGASESGVFRWSEAEAALSGNFSPDALNGLSVPAKGMIGDLHGTPEYRAHLAGVMTRRAVAAAS